MTTLNVAELAAFSRFAYEDTENLTDPGIYPARIPAGFVRLTVAPNTANGFYAAAFRNGSGQVVIAIRGTSDIQDWLTANASFGDGEIPPQFDQAMQFLADVKEQVPGLTNDNIVITGHSLGGGLAAMMSVATGIEATAFDAPKIGQFLEPTGGLTLRYGTPPDGFQSKISLYWADLDPVHNLPPFASQVGTPLGQFNIAEPSFKGQLIGTLAGFLLGPMFHVANSAVTALLGWLSYRAVDQHDMEKLLLAIQRDLNYAVPLTRADGTAVLDASAEAQAYLNLVYNALDPSISTTAKTALQDKQFDRVLVDGSASTEPQGHTLDARGYGTSRDLFVGDAAGDFLRGGAGDDALLGGAGPDRLEGGTDNDLLIGGVGMDQYLFQAGDGVDVVIDTDGKGLILRNNARLALGVKQSDGQWQLDGNTFTRNGTDLDVTFAGSTDKITIKDFDFAAAQAGGYLGVHLVDQPTAPQSAVRTFYGDKQDWDSDPNTDGIQPQNDAFGNSIRADGQGGRPDIAQAGRADFFFGSDANEVERFTTGDSNDTVYGDGSTSATSAQGGDDLIETGVGGDVAVGGAGNDWIEGGADADIIVGNDGDDTLFAGATASQSLALAQAIADGETGTPGVGSGDLLTGDAGNDVLIGETTADLLSGGTGADIIVGAAGDDTIYGDMSITSALQGWSVTRTVDNGAYTATLNNITYSLDPLIGADDLVYGGAGDDWIFGGYGQDSIDAGSGNDIAFGEAGNDIIFGGSGNDVLVGDNAASVSGQNEGSDYLDGGDGDDQIVGGGGDDIIVGGPGHDVLMGNAGKDVYVFNRGDGSDDYLDEDTGPDLSVLMFGDGYDQSQLRNLKGSLQLDFGGGDVIHILNFNHLDPNASAAFESLVFSDGTSLTFAEVLARGFDIDGTEGDDDDHDAFHPKLMGTAYVDRIRGFAGNDTLSGFQGNDSLDGGSGDDTLFGGTGDDVIAGGIGNDQLVGEEGADSLDGGDGDDQLFGDGDQTALADQGADTIHGGAGNDNVRGYGGADQIFGDAGIDYLYGEAGNDYIEGGADGDYLFGDFDSLTGETVQDGSDTLLGGDGGDQLVGYGGNDSLFGDDGADTLFGGSGNDVLDGGAGDGDWVQGDAGDDTLTGGAGNNDVLLGGAGNDTYLFNLGDGADIVHEDSAIDTEVLRFGAGIAASDLGFSRVGSDLIIRHSNGTDQVTVENWYAGSGFQMTRLEFADASVITAADANNRGLQFQLGTAGNDTLAGTSGNDTLNGLGGNDTLFGNGGNDVFIGDTGNDTLNGSSGNDTYQFSASDGADTIRDTGGNDSLVFGAGLAKAQFTASRTSVGDLVLARTGTTDSVTIKDWFNALNNKIETIRFVDTGELYTNAELVDPFLTFNGTAGNDTLAGGAYNETFTGLAGDDFIQAGGGDDFIQGGTGNDNIFGDTGFDTFRYFAGDGQDTVDDTDGLGVVYFGNGLADKAVFTIVSNGRLVTFTGTATDSVLIKDPTIVTFNKVQTKFDRIGTEAIDTIVGNSFNEVIHGLGGADSINGGDGNDEIYGDAGNDTLEGGPGSDLLDGGDGDDVLDGNVLTSTSSGGGFDRYVGGRGNDTLNGGSLTDTYFFNVGDGQDIIDDQPFVSGITESFSNEDEVDFGAGISADTLSGSKSGSDLIVIISPTDRITIKNQFLGDNHAVEIFRFSDGSTMNEAQINGLQFVQRGTSGNDTLTGGTGNDQLTGGPGDDLLQGGAGDDTYFINGGDGRDTISETSGTDTIQYGAGLTASGIALSRNVNSLVLSVNGTTDSVTITNYLTDANARVENFVFTDGSQLPAQAQILDQLINVNGTAGDDALTGSAGYDVLYGLDGNDTLSALADNDTLYGGNGDDTLIGGTGNDALYGEAGNDIYQYAVGDGQDRINDSAGADQLVFGSGIATTAIVLGRTSAAPSNLVVNVNVAGNPGVVTIENYFSGQDVEQIKFADGTVWDVPTVRAKVLAAAQTSGDDIIYGYETDDTINGLAGNDLISAGAGNDTVDGGTGSDTIYGEDGDDLLNAGTGDANNANVVNVLYGGNGNDVLNASGKPDQLFGEAGNDVLRGGAAANILQESSGNNVLDAQAADDTLRGGAGNDAFIGGAGNDGINGDFNNTGVRGQDIVLFNKGAGTDTVSALGSGSTLSMGGGMLYSNLAFTASGNTLTVSAGTGSVAFTDWYSGNKAVSKLQIVIEGTRDYSATSPNPMNNKKIQTFDFLGLVNAFDAARAAGQTFNVANNLPTYRLSGSDTDAIGGAIAYQYNKNGSIGTITDAQLKTILASSNFGVNAQPIDPTAPQSFAAMATTTTSTTTTSSADSVMLASPSLATTSTASPTVSSSDWGQTDTSADSGQTDAAPRDLPVPADAVGPRLQAIIERWFEEAEGHQLISLSKLEEIRNGVLAATACGIAGAEIAAQWKRASLALELHLADYADVGVDLAATNLVAAALTAGSTPAVDALGLSVSGTTLTPLQGLKEGFASLV